ncbi:hypothetical protein JFL47_01965 [Haemophilus haemoglobinophilus]|nr:hypothetical protein [Canicola haemoglobinophilus]
MKKLTQKIFKYHKLLLSTLILATSTHSYSISKKELFNKLSSVENDQQAMEIFREYGKSNKLTEAQLTKLLMQISKEGERAIATHDLIVLIDNLIQFNYSQSNSFEGLSVEKIINTGEINKTNISKDRKKIIHAWKGKVDIQPNKEEDNTSYLITLNKVPNSELQCQAISLSILKKKNSFLKQIIINGKSLVVKNYEDLPNNEKINLLKQIKSSCNEKDNKITFVFH